MLDGNSAAERQYAAAQAREVRDTEPHLAEALDSLVEDVLSGGRIWHRFEPITLETLRQDHPGTDIAGLEHALRERLEDSDLVSERAAEIAAEVPEREREE